MPRLIVRKIAVSLAMFAVVALGSAVAARADTFTFALTTVNSAGFPSQYGSVLVNRTDSTHATLTFTADESHPGLTYLFGGQGAVGANFNGLVQFTFASANTTLAGLSALSFAGAGNEDGFGRFSFTLDNNGGFVNAVRAITFSVTLTCGSWSSAADVLTPNASGNSVAAHLFVCGSSPCDRSNPALLSGFVTNSGPTTPTPEPASVLLLGTGLLGVAGAARRRFSKK